MDKVIVITLNYNQNNYTLDCVNSLLQSEYDNFEIYLIDNGSSVENYVLLEKALVKDFRLRLIRLEENIGYVGGINHGLKIAIQNSAGYFLIMNNDTIIDSYAITSLVDAANRHSNNAIVSGKVYNYDDKDTLQFIGNAKSTKGPLDFPAYVKNRREKDLGQFDREMEMGMLDDIFWLIPKSVQEKVGYYSDYFFLYGEQTDYALRSIAAGVKLVYTPGAKIWHKGKVTTANGEIYSPKIFYWGSFAVLKISVLHFSKKERRKILWNRLIIRPLKLLKFVIKGKASFSIILANYLAILHFLVWRKVKYKDNGYNPFS